MITKQQAEELKAAIDKMIEPEKVSDEWPYDGRYFSIRNDGTIDDDSWDGSKIDFDRQLRGNIYRTCEEAELADKRRLAYVELVNAINTANGGWVPDWNNNCADKCALNYTRGTISIGWWCDCRHYPNELYCQSKRNLNKILTDLGSDKIKLAMGWT